MNKKEDITKEDAEKIDQRIKEQGGNPKVNLGEMISKATSTKPVTRKPSKKKHKKQ